MSDTKIANLTGAADNAALERQSAALERAKARVGASAQGPQAHHAAEEFEALLVHQMMQAMWKTVPQGGILPTSREEEYFRDMLNEALAESISKGEGIGVREVIEREINRLERSAGPTVKDH